MIDKEAGESEDESEDEDSHDLATEDVAASHIGAK